MAPGPLLLGRSAATVTATGTGSAAGSGADEATGAVPFGLDPRGSSRSQVGRWRAGGGFGPARYGHGFTGGRAPRSAGHGQGRGGGRRARGRRGRPPGRRPARRG